VEIPRFNVHTGKREYKGNYLQMGKKDVLIIEGIHCLNDELSYSLPMDRVELLLKHMAQILAANTNYATMISGPTSHLTKLKFIQLSRVEEKKLLIVVVVEGNIIRNSFVNLEEDVSNEDVLNLNILLNNSLNGLTIQEINLGMISKLKEQAGIHKQVVELVLNEVSEAIQAQDADLQIYTSGATNIFKYPELSDTQKASQLLNTLEQKELLKGLFDDKQLPAASNSQIQVYIGDETPIQSMKDCSVVTANYVLGDGLRGTIGIIGPKRMDYEKVVGTLRNLVSQLNDTFNQ
ncbi:MAG: hypothetical protein II263_04140, partial [Lachnospiraceae bacterium]|nr:hypothetical protein [Lachnospiraceae bacterium]